MAKILDGKKLADEILQGLKSKQTTPTLAILSVTDDPASEVYIRNKVRACKEVGVSCIAAYLPENGVDINETARRILCSWGANASVDGVIVQLPCHLNDDPLWIPIEKDVDGFQHGSPYMACTPKGILRLIDTTGVSLDGLNAVVVGRSDIVGKPMAKALMDRNCTVTVCHSHTTDLASHTKQADILVVAVGKPNLITADMVKPGAVVIDVGINRVDGKLVGDVEFEHVKDVAGWITPVPGGVGPMTVAMLLENVFEAKERVKHDGY